MARGTGTEKEKNSKERNMVNTFHKEVQGIPVLAFHYLFTFQKSNWIHAIRKKNMDPIRDQEKTRNISNSRK